MEFTTDITFNEYDDVNYIVEDEKGGRYFIGELDEALDFYNAWSVGEEPYDDVEYLTEYEFEINLDESKPERDN